MELELSIKEAGNGLKGMRVSDRKKNAEIIKQYLADGNAVPSLLSENTLKKRGYTWNNLFDDINDYIFKETEKFEQSKTFENSTRPLCTSLLHHCVAGSNKGKAYIKCEKITDTSLYILKDNRLAKAFGDSYLSLLLKHVLPYRHYLGHITPSTWKELLDVSIAACFSTDHKMDSYTKLRLILLIMKSGTENCQFVRPLIESLSSLETYFGLVANDKKVQDVVIMIIILLLETLSSECRLTMCRFIESFLPSLLKFYDQNKDQKKKTSLFNLLNLAVAIHHPLGRHQNEEGSLANNWDIWNKYLNSITEIICLEVNYLQKNRKQNDRTLQQCSYFHSLAASVFHQVFKLSERSGNDTETPSKKFKVSVNKNKTFCDLVNELQQNHVPWLGIIHEYTKAYGTDITPTEYLALLNCLQIVLANKSGNLDWDMYKKLVCLVLECSYVQMSDAEDYKNSLLSLWNSCVRCCTSTNTAHPAIHMIMHGVLNCNILEYPTHLIKQYLEKEMPVTTHSVTTLTHIFRKFYSKCSFREFKVKCLAWLTAGDSLSFCVAGVPELLLRIISNDNIVLNTKRNINSECDQLHEILFNSLEKCILFSKFEIDDSIKQPVIENALEHIETDSDLQQQIQEFLRTMLTDNISKRLQTHIELSMTIKLMNVVLTYLDFLIKLNIKSHDEIKTFDIYTLLVTALTRMYSSFNAILEKGTQIQFKVELLELVKELLLAEFDPMLAGLLRSTIDADMFHSINNILNTEVESDDDDIIIDGDEDEMNIETLKKRCLLVLAAYCRKHAEYRDDISKLILDEYVYNFTSDTECAFQCIEMLIDSRVQDPPLGLIFTLMQRMCQKLYRDSQATYGILKILLRIMDALCSGDSSMKDNCFIMIKSYLQLCQDTHYPPRVASLIFECAAKVILMSRKHDCEEAFIEQFLKTIKCNVHSIRLSCCYLLKLINIFSEDKVDDFSANLLEIFLTELPIAEESILKDESANRTFTVLHCFIALAQTKKLPSLTIILLVIHIQKVKCFDKHIVLKVLNRITHAFGIKDLATYLNTNIVAVIYFWFSKQNKLGDLPISLFGFENIEMFIEKHMKWLIAGEILWKCEGAITKSYILNQVAKKRNKPLEQILEICFSNIMSLCLPYVVCEKYDISCCETNQAAFKKSMKNAIVMFQATGEMLGNDRWSSIFVENIGELLLLTATHMSDPKDTEKLFDVKLPRKNQEYVYPKQIFCAILKYFEDLTDGSVLQYLCKNQTVTVFKILFELWKAVNEKEEFELKVLALHAFVVFIKNIPLNHSSDAFICNFACNGLMQVIKDCNSKDEMRCYIKALRIVLDYLLPHTAALMRKALLELLPILLKQKEAGFEQECSECINYLTNNMKEHMRESEDVVDFLGSINEAMTDDMLCPDLTVFKEKLKTHKISLKRPSHETLLNIRQFLSCNTSHIQQLHRDLDSQSFAEECETTIVHHFVQSLCNILKSTCDDKTIIEACNCLSIISSYNLKTLVTVPPAYTERVKTVNPTRFFLQVVGKSLLEVLFDQDAAITDEVSETLKNLLKSLDIDEIPDLELLDKQIIKPFSSHSSASTFDTVTDGMKFEEYCTMCPEGIFLTALFNKSSNDWLKEVTCTLLQFIYSPTNYVKNLRQVCSLKSSVCRKILPALVGLLIQGLSERHVKAVGVQIKRFFNYIWDQTFDEILENSGGSNINSRTSETMTHNFMKIIQYMLDILDFIRIQRNYYKSRPGTAIQSLNFLHLEYDKVAWAAAVTDQNWAAIYYGELWAIFQNNGVSPSSPEITSSLVGGTNLQRIFRKCFVSIGETDAIEGCGTAHLTIENEKRKHLINTGQFSDALLLHDIALSCGSQTDPDLHYGVVRSLHKSGMHHLALRYIKSLPENDQLNDVKYDCLAFLGDWSDFVDTKNLEEKYKQKNCNHNSIVKEFQYACLKSCLNMQTTSEYENKMLLPLNKAKLAVSKLCHNLNMKNCQNIYKVLEKLHILKDIEDYSSVRTNRLQLAELLRKWDIENLPQFMDFKHIETFSSQRVLLLEHAAKAHSGLLTEIVSLQTQYSQLALNNRRVQMAQRLLAVAKKSKLSEDITLVESEIAWAKGHTEIALSLLRNIIDNQSCDVKLAAVSLRRYGLWMAESKRDNPREIIHKYLKKSLDVLKNDHIDVKLKVYHDIAKFADAEYKQVVAYMNSSIYENRVKCLENMKGTASSLGTKSTKALTKEEGRALSTNRKFKELDEAEIANTQVEKDNYLHLAMRYYLLSLKQCDDNNLSVFRVISLWLANQNFAFRPEENYTFEELLNTIPSWKFVTVLPQLAPRLTNEDTVFMNNLKNIIQRCAIEHPHHTLPILFGLKNSDKDNVIMNASGSSVSSGRARATPQPRVTAAQALVSQLRAPLHHLTTIITQMEKLCDAIISFANYVPPSRQKKQKIPDAENIHKLRNLNNIPIPTVTLAIRKDCKYTYIHTLQSFDKFYELVGGVNCPKKINCTDSSGKVNILLIKGGDDLKQDAVMQQVFNIVNTLLEKDPVTHKNKLLIRTYKVVPMSRLSGVLEWCEGTIPMGLYLAAPDNTGAHSRYRPQDISCDIARKKMMDNCNQSHEVKLAVFNRILKEFKPVFQYFFIEHYLDPVTWYERRLAYTKSVATSSMVGYILGLGDRHMYNILIDKRTAEVIHIDLGIAFEQGKTLRTPETVPFRLTRDIIAGFGSSGTEGTFKRCCEKTMQLLRDNQETLLTILEVLLCDPLYSWSVKTAQQNAPNSSIDTSAVCMTSPASGLAERALLVVTSKLCGTDDGGAAGVAVAGQVARLLHVATDPFNLCRLFHGWQPYL